MISNLLTKKMIGGFVGNDNTAYIFFITLILFIIELLLRAYIVKWGYNNINEHFDLPELKYEECLILVIVILCLFTK